MDRLGDEVRARVLTLVRRPQSRQVLLETGLRDADLRRLLRRTALRHYHGHYVDGRLDEHFARIACAQALHPGSVVSHFSAASLAGLRNWTDGRRQSAPPTDAVWLTRPPTTKRNQRRQDIVVRRAALEPADVSRHLWLPVTGAARTVVDLARTLPFREAIVTVDDALRSGVRTIGEADGLAKYESESPEERRRQLRRSYRRDQRLSDRAVELVHFGWEDVLDPRSDLIARLRAAFARGSSRPGDPPIWRAPARHDPAFWLHAA
ncbi:hypothetical protein EV649_5305 [Kribbella sp. VKM Ac-2569]|uniref:hypothetical protein n=1 Tax=Kribbella sp. VKM Ac-2569 TaxID=2512220 RepID=UPI00102C44E8|nr:hypothetical protein [Kribbella sp. VKM Ac-2569]RZT17748.1 hypothetical protein EV649_5305 [Kribbella sp. VKM Ac-2569]